MMWRAAAKYMAEKLAERWPVIFRGSIYFLIPFLGILGDKIGPMCMKDEWPSWPRILGACVIGAAAGFVGLRAYFDGSAQRWSDERKKNGNGAAPH